MAGSTSCNILVTIASQFILWMAVFENQQVAGNMPEQFQQNVFPLGTKPPHQEEEEEERECSEPENDEESSEDGFNTGEGGEKGICRKYEDHSYSLFLRYNTITTQCLVHMEALVGHHGAMRQEVK